MSVKTRFAPSPTGMLHVGNTRTALINWLFTKKYNGSFMLRMDDTDLARSKLEYEEAIKEDLRWLGLEWDSYAKQSERLARYEEIKQKLIKEKRLYPCYETQEELDMKRKLLLGRGLPPIYDRSALNLTEKQKEELLSQGRKPHYRFLLNNENIEWNDLIKGNVHFQAKNLSDPIVIREDGSMTYILCSAIDDVDFNITHVIRGEDHLTNTAIGIQITKAIGAKPPTMGHLALLKSKTDKISKRVGGFEIKALREQFIEPMAIKSLLAKMGSSDSIEVTHNINKLVEEFDTKKFSSSAVNYDLNELLQLNHKLISNLSFEEIELSLKAINNQIGEDFWNATRGNLVTLDEIQEWWKICKEDVMPVISAEDKDFLIQSLNLLPQDNWDLSTWDEWVQELKLHTGRLGKSLFMPLRLALTGKESGPELKVLLPLIGIDKTKARLSGKNA